MDARAASVGRDVVRHDGRMHLEAERHVVRDGPLVGHDGLVTEVAAPAAVLLVDVGLQQPGGSGVVGEPRAQECASGRSG